MKNSIRSGEHTKKSMHVLFTGLVSSTVLTGGDQLFLDIAPRLPKDITITVITPLFAKKHWDNVKQSNIKLKFLPPSVFDLKTNPVLIFLSYVVRSWHVYKILRKEDVQTIYSCSDIAYADIWPAFFIAKKHPKVKWLSRIYHVLLPPANRPGNYFVNIIAFRLQRLSFWMMKKNSSTILALNHKLYDEVLELGLPKKKLSILGAGIDFQMIDSFKPTKNEAYDVVVLGRIAPVKGIFDTIKIWTKIHKDNPDLKLAWIGGGGGSYQTKMNELIAENSLESSFHMLGFVSVEEKYTILKQAKVFLCPDHENGWGLAVCEAMASGLPVISYDLDIFGGVYKKGFITSRLFDTQGFADNINLLLNDEKLRKKMAIDALKQAKEFDHQKVINDLVKYLAV